MSSPNQRLPVDSTTRPVTIAARESMEPGDRSMLDEIIEKVMPTASTSRGAFWAMMNGTVWLLSQPGDSRQSKMTRAPMTSTRKDRSSRRTARSALVPVMVPAGAGRGR